MSIPATISKGEFLKQLPALREFAASLASDKDPRMARRGNAMSLWLDIASAQTHQERHARIRQLPVTVRTSQASEDGRVVKEFVMEGKTRLQVSFAVAPSHSALSGPSISDDCYGGEPEPCSTQEDMDDLFVLLADSNNELSSGQADLDQEWAEYDDYCSNNPWDCDGNHLEVMPSGPSAAECDASGGCVGDAVAATAQGLAAGLEIVDGYVAAQGAVAEGVMLSIGEAAAIADGITIAVGVFGFFAYNFIQCKRAKVRAPLEFVQDRASLRNLAWSPVTSGAEL
jgi:hypothetical protein